MVIFIFLYARLLIFIFDSPLLILVVAFLISDYTLVLCCSLMLKFRVFLMLPFDCRLWYSTLGFQLRLLIRAFGLPCLLSNVGLSTLVVCFAICGWQFWFLKCMFDSGSNTKKWNIWIQNLKEHVSQKRERPKNKDHSQIITKKYAS